MSGSALSLLLGNRGRPVPVDEWVEVAGRTHMMLAFEPPDGCGQGSLDVHVEQESSGRKAVVEFGFDPDAKGAGCYVV